MQLHAEIEATTVKINFLKGTEATMIYPAQIPVLGAEAAEITVDASAATSTQLDQRLTSSLQQYDRTAPLVRMKLGAHAQFSPPDLGPDKHHILMKYNLLSILR